jgi:hypothetical protein
VYLLHRLQTRGIDPRIAAGLHEMWFPRLTISPYDDCDVSADSIRRIERVSVEASLQFNALQYKHASLARRRRPKRHKPRVPAALGRVSSICREASCSQFIRETCGSISAGVLNVHLADLGLVD